MIEDTRNGMKRVTVHAFLALLALGAVTGSPHHDYMLGARAGQSMSVSLVNKGSAYFNILAPGSHDVAIFIGSRDGENASFRLPSDGDYRIRGHLIGDDKDSGRTVPYTLSVAIM